MRKILPCQIWHGSTYIFGIPDTHVVVARDLCVANVLVGNDSEVAAVDVASTVERCHVLRLSTEVVLERQR